MRTDYQLRGGSIFRILKKMLRATASAVVLSGASTMLAAETQGLAIDFTDIYFLAATGHAGSVKVIDLTTPANNYNSHPYGLLTNAGTLKLTRQSDGVYRFQAHNICLQSETFSASPWSSYFMAAATPTTLTFQAYAFAQQFQSFTAIAGATYEFGVEARVSSGAGKCRVKVNDGGDVFSSDFDLTTDWRVCSITRTVGQASCAVGISNGTDAIARTIEVRRAYIRRTPCASIYLSTTSAAKYALPFEWDTSGNLSGILVEPAATNLLTYSTQFNNVAWTKSSDSTVSVDAATAPNGTNAANKIIANSGGGKDAYPYQTTIVSAGLATVSFFLKAAGFTWAQMFFESGAKASAWFDLSNGVVGTISGSLSGKSARIESVGNGWYKCSLTATADGASGSYGVAIRSADAGTSVTGDGISGLYLWNGQLETGSVATSPIITYGATVTRAADSGITLSTAAIPFSAAAGTLFATISHRDTSLCYAACIDSGSTANQIALAPTDGDNSRNFVITSNVTQASDADINVNVETTGKCAFAWASNDTTISTNGSIGTNDTSVTLPTVTTVRIGDRFGGGRSLNGYIKKLMYLPRRMSNAELQAITA